MTRDAGVCGEGRAVAVVTFAGVLLPGPVESWAGRDFGDWPHPVVGERTRFDRVDQLRLERLRVLEVQAGRVEVEITVALDPGSGQEGERREVSLRCDLVLDDSGEGPCVMLDGRFRPTSQSVILIDTDAAGVLEWLVPWREEVSGAKVTASVVDGGLTEILGRLAPLAAPWSRFAVVPLRSGWTAVYNNSLLGTDRSGVAYFAEALGCRCVSVLCRPEVRSLAVYAADALPGSDDWVVQNLVRLISWSTDEGYEFHSVGEPFAFEGEAGDSAGAPREKFTACMLRRYLVALGCDVFDVQQHMPGGQAWLVEERQPLRWRLSRDTRGWSYEDVQAGRPWRRA